MALIQCPECGRDVSDRAEKCIHCGCPLDGARQKTNGTDDPNYNYNQNRVVIQDNKAKRLWAILLWVIFLIVLFLPFIIVQSGNSGKSGSTTLDPNRTWESCSAYGEARVFGSMHDTSYCFPDYDGYYHILDGHHHHK